MKVVYLISLIILLLSSCKNNPEVEAEPVSENPFFEYFYEYDSIPKIYMYRNIANGIEEQYHRVYSIEDSKGKHIIVETYVDEGRITEALNYNVDSLTIFDHMVVGKGSNKFEAELIKGGLMPQNKTDISKFVSRFPGPIDSTFILKEVDRKYMEEISHEVLGKKYPTALFFDQIRMTEMNPWKKQQKNIEGEAIYYFAKGFGLVEWHTPNKKAHYRLERVMTQKEFLNLIRVQ